MARKQQIDITEQKLLPHDLDTEVAVLSALMRYNEKIAQYDDLLSVDLFYYEKEKAIYRSIVGVVNDGGITDINSLNNYALTHETGYDIMREDFVALVSHLNKATIEQDIMRLRDMARRRSVWRTLQESSQRILDMTTDFDEEVSSTVGIMGELQSDGAAGNIVNNDDTLKEIRQMTVENRQGKNNSLLTGFKLFDDKYVLRPGTLTVIAAFTSVGKSALALNIVRNVAKNGIPCAYYSLEMSRTELAARGLSSMAGLTSSTILNKCLTDEQLQKLEKAMQADKGLPIYYDDRSTVDFNRTMRSIRTMVRTRDVKLVVIDYLQIYAQTGDDEEKSIAYMARTCKNIAKELDIPLLVISQLNRSALHPSIKMLRGSGQIEESADNIVLIDRPDAYPDNKVTHYEGEFKGSNIKGTAKFILAKGRGSGTGSDLVQFDEKTVCFKPIETTEAGHYEEQEEQLPF